MLVLLWNCLWKFFYFSNNQLTIGNDSWTMNQGAKFWLRRTLSCKSYFWCWVEKHHLSQINFEYWFSRSFWHRFFINHESLHFIRFLYFHPFFFVLSCRYLHTEDVFPEVTKTFCCCKLFQFVFFIRLRWIIFDEQKSIEGFDLNLKKIIPSGERVPKFPSLDNSK